MSVTSEIYPNPKNKPVGPLITVIPVISVQVERISGSGAVGTYIVQVSNSGKKFEDDDVVLSGVGVFEVTPPLGQIYRVFPLTPPDSGTVVLVSLFAIEISEGAVN